MNKCWGRWLAGLAIAYVVGFPGLDTAMSAADDLDSDGVDDAVDCAPADPRLSSLHTYYVESDGDGFGDPDESFSICDVKPFAGGVLWGDDPAPTDNAVIANVVPKGVRGLGLAALDTAADAVLRLDLARELGVDAVGLELQWSAIETTVGSFDGPQASILGALNSVLADQGLSLNLTLGPIVRDGLSVPADLAGPLASGSLTFGDPVVTARFRSLLDFVHGELQDVPIVALHFGSEVDAYVPVNSTPAFWSGLGAGLADAAQHARTLWGGALPVGVNATRAGLTNEPAATLMESANSSADVISVNYFPRNADFTARAPQLVPADIEELLTRYPTRPVFFNNVGYPSSPAVMSSQTMQSQFFHALFDTWDANADRIDFVGFGRFHDRSAAKAAQEAARPTYAVPPDSLARATAYFETLGVREFAGNGREKTGYHSLRNLAFEREWWRSNVVESRSFLLGMAPHPYDLNPGEPLIESVVDEMFSVIDSHADLVSYHFDAGVPWPEAETDDGSSPLPPYGAHLLDTWSKYRDRQPSGMTSAVSINPLGIPRDELAPYWGFGEGFYHDESFELVGTGAFLDYQERLRPAPFDALDYDSPAVKTAFLNYAKRVIEYFGPDYLITGLEVNLAIDPNNPAAFQKYVELQKFVYEQLRADPAYDDVQILVSFVAEYFMTDELGVPVLFDTVLNEGLSALHVQALQDLLPYVDAVGLSIYPSKTRWGTNLLMPSTFDQLFETIGTLTNKPIAITETGFPGTSYVTDGLNYFSTPARQARFLRLLYSTLEKHGGAEFVVNFTTHDLTLHMDKLRARSLEQPPFISPSLVEFLQSFEFIGIYDANGAPKAAADALAETFALPIEQNDVWVNPITLASPDGQVEVVVGVDATGRLQYTLNRSTVPVVEASSLGLVIDGVDLGSGVTQIEAGPIVAADETYPTRGAHSIARNHYEETVVTARRVGTGDPALEIVFRLYDDGLAFRYRIPGTFARSVQGESSTWTLPDGAHVWFQPNTANYESVYFGVPIGGFDNTIGAPFTAELPGTGGYLTITEAGLRNFSGLTYAADLQSRVIRSEFLDDSSFPVQGGSYSPWRLTIVTEELDGLVNSDMVTNVSEPPDASLFPDGGNESWIRPGRAVWSFWSDFDSGYFFDIQQQYVDYAASLGVEYAVVDAWWDLGFPDGGSDEFERLAELVDYGHADGRSVDIFVWKNWWEMVDPIERQAFFQAVADAGAVGVKIDNNAAESSESFLSIYLYEEILKDAAARQLMVNFHGSNKPTGLSRTYPNEITREGFAGLELNGLAWELGQFIAPYHDTVLPFTRFVAGPGDYTPVTFDARKIGDTTFTHQLATAGMFPSGLLHFADDPAVLLQQTDVLDVLTGIPNLWDETRVLPGSSIGEVALFARRKDANWYLFAVNGNATDPVVLAGVDLSFLGAGDYDAIFVADASPTSFDRQQVEGVSSSYPLDIDMLPGGGFVGVFTPEQVGTRPFRLGFTSIPPANTPQGWEDGFVALRDHADLVAHNFQEGVPWVEALTSSDYRDYSDSLQSQWNILRAADQVVVPNHAVYVLINPIEVSYERIAPYWGVSDKMPLPPPWDQYDFNHPDIKQAFTNYVIAAVEHFEPTFLAIGVEANILLAKRPLQWEAYKELNQHVYETLKALYPDLVVLTSVHYEHMIALHRESIELQILLAESYPGVLESEVKQLLQYSDVFALSTYPYMVANNPLMGPDNVVPEYYDTAYRIAQETGKPIAIDQTGFISEDLYFEPLDFTIPGSEEVQANFIGFLLDEALAHDFRFILNFVGIDYGNNYGTDSTTLTWSHAGLLREDNTPKPALALWDAVRALPYDGTGSPPPPPSIEVFGAVETTTTSLTGAEYTLTGGRVASVELMDSDIVRVRVSTSSQFTDWESGAIAPSGLSDPQATVFDRADATFLVTTSISVIVQKDPFQVLVLRPDGSPILIDADHPIAWVSDSGVLINRKSAAPDERFFGLGLRGGPLDRRNDEFVMRNTDHFGYGEFDGPLYSSTPFYYGYRDGSFYGVFVDSPSVPFFNMDADGSGDVTFGAFQTELDYYVFGGPGPEDVASAYARLTGFVPLPPKWALGFHQSRFGYDSFDQILDIATMFRQLQIPVDAMYLDLDYMENLDWFSWDPVAFPDPIGNNQILESMGIKRVNIVDPSIQPDDPLYDFLAQSHFFLEDANGDVVRNNIFLPFGEVSWFDYTRTDAATFYMDQLKDFLDTGVSGIWNDINEPAANSMPHAIYDFDGQKRTDLQARNLYALENVKWTQQAMLEHRPNERPFILARSGYAGSQRYNANWSGDSLSTFDSLRVSIQMSLHMSLSGMTLFGHDIGGFLGTPNAELLTRWMQFASFNPYMRNHAVNTSSFTEPWVYGEPYTSVIRDAIEQRYRWMPYLYSLVETASRTAEPVLAPTYFLFPEDGNTFDQDTEFLLGPYVLGAPVFEEGATTRTLYLPAGTDWYDFHSGQLHSGGQSITVDAPLSRIPMFVRAGAIIPGEPLKQWVDEPVTPRVNLELYPGPEGVTEAFSLYEDDGVTFDYQQGDYLRTLVSSTRQSGVREVSIQETEGGWVAPVRPWFLNFHDFSAAAQSVTTNGAALPMVASEVELAAAANAWLYRAADNVVVVKIDSTLLPFTVLVTP